jgi:hypothetical protein
MGYSVHNLFTWFVKNLVVINVWHYSKIHGVCNWCARHMASNLSRVLDWSPTFNYFSKIFLWLTFYNKCNALVTTQILPLCSDQGLEKTFCRQSMHGCEGFTYFEDACDTWKYIIVIDQRYDAAAKTSFFRNSTIILLAENVSFSGTFSCQQESVRCAEKLLSILATCLSSSLPSLPSPSWVPCVQYQRVVLD